MQFLNVRFVYVSTGLEQMLGIEVSGFRIRVENGRRYNSCFAVVLCLVNTDQWIRTGRGNENPTYAEFVEAIVRFLMAIRVLLHAIIGEEVPGHVWDIAFMAWVG